MEMDKTLALKALSLLDSKLAKAGIRVTLAVGGGGSMILQHDYSGSTVDIDAIPVNVNFDTIHPYMSEVARELKIAGDWINPYYGAYTVYLPSDAKSRMQKTYSGKALTAMSLGAEDVLIMKLMAGRSKDNAHIKHLLSMNLNLSIVENRLEELKKLYPKEAKKALDRFDDWVGNL